MLGCILGEINPWGCLSPYQSEVLSPKRLRWIPVEFSLQSRVHHKQGAVEWLSSADRRHRLRSEPPPFLQWPFLGQVWKRTVHRSWSWNTHTHTLSTSKLFTDILAGIRYNNRNRLPLANCFIVHDVGELQSRNAVYNKTIHWKWTNSLVDIETYCMTRRGGQPNFTGCM